MYTLKCQRCQAPIESGDVYSIVVLYFYRRGLSAEDDWVDSEAQVDKTLCASCAVFVREQVVEAVAPGQEKNQARA